MPITILDNGRNNRIHIDPDVLDASSATLLLRGSDNRVDIARGVLLEQASITLGDSCSLRVGMNCRLAAIEVMAVRDAHVDIGERSEFTWSTRIYLHEASRVTVGSDCLIASDTLMMSSDMHSIIDVQTRRRINPAADITISDRVWLAFNSTVLKGASIGAGSVIGYRSTVNGPIPENSLAAGAPARVLKSGITWDRNLL